MNIYDEYFFLVTMEHTTLILWIDNNENIKVSRWNLAFQMFLKQLTSDFSKTVASVVKEEQWTGVWNKTRISEDWESKWSMRDDLRDWRDRRDKKEPND